ncbi:hypothetical protein B9Z19DRAFT_1127829 [Tuber borchii]|uniref:Transposase Tc1-like domain-containing protein n=1 Tax=Tuber borchii TaxID=42251 RepID=A0A2T6ZQN0_TUBBO|nr:hypothetical protein B9Z19DRAFT_1127829 [Tuber borchii]
MPTTQAQAAQSRLITDTGSNVSSIEGVANVSFDEYIKWYIDHQGGFSALLEPEGEENGNLRANVSLPVLDGEEEAEEQLEDLVEEHTEIKRGGWTYRQLHEEFNVPMGSLHRLIHDTSSAASSSPTNESRGRKPVFTPDIKRLLIKTATASAYNRHLPLSEVAKLAGIKASDRSLHRIFCSQGYNRRVARIKPFLNAETKQKRLDWGWKFHDWAESDWADVIFSDEAAFNCGQLSGTIWVTRKPSEEYDEDCLVPKFKKLTTVMVWGAICGSQKSPLVVWETDNWGKITSETYIQ